MSTQPSHLHAEKQTNTPSSPVGTMTFDFRLLQECPAASQLGRVRGKTTICHSHGGILNPH